MSIKLTSSDIGELTAPALGDWLYTVDVSSTSDDAAGDSMRMLAAYSGKQFSGTSFPVSNLWDGMPFHRTDIGPGMTCFYDETNTQWLSETEYIFSHPERGATASWYFYDRLPTDGYSIYITSTNVQSTTKAQTTNDGSNYWTVTISVTNTTFDDDTVIHTYNTSADTVDIFTVHDDTPDDRTPSSSAGVQISLVKTSSPGSLVFSCAFRYRLIIT